VTGHAHSLSEWAAFLSLGVGFWSSCAAVVWLIADADLKDFDPRPATRRVAAVVHQGAVCAGHDFNRAYALVSHEVRTAWTRAALSLAAFLILTIPNGDVR
jgi:hypothetical protein